ncbi:2-isopropylmalate synthase [Pelagicoccus sp. NFK12]|uniref:2-isopropylmalate synthase n=1 Tax=Pelagicoccus enzymogenes TaxID=2773457 RepID=A0A927FFB1_9BACT|nr:2-isopropylmalate synthase [Pelagicoccus enzymogenes]MBD5782343.1 2-isopropylmalate synthase [Pelagicoccus enzymogenes]MDQ8199259.1 2-isopropylmalate synthase [Pelagicoccus enzymogenes]
MQKKPISKYRPYPVIDLPDRQWPSRTIDKAPIWCSVDLRDGNQSLAIPMNVEEKVELFKTLVNIGFKEIEVGFPSASETEFAFLRRLVSDKLIPDDVTIQVLVQCREHLIRRTFESLEGVKRAIVHIYNSTNPLQRRVVFGSSKEEIRDIAVEGARLVKELVPTLPGTEIVLQYSPESFSDTELEFSLECCEAVADVWEPTPERKMILNLPATVELFTPNVHADQIEWFCRNFSRRDSVVISLHTHNDRGTGVAATELGLLAGADRVEGTLFGNGERTGNLDIVIVALNMYTQGLDPELDFSNLNDIREVYERVTKMDVPPRSPYGGDLVFTAFSGSHQDAIKKGFAQMPADEKALWQVPYMTIDPKDLGRSYRAIIRINSQSGKGGVAYIMEKEYGFNMPKAMHKELGAVVNAIADETGEEITPAGVYECFQNEYIRIREPLDVIEYRSERLDDKTVEGWAVVRHNGVEQNLRGTGNGPIAAFVDSVASIGYSDFELLSYSEHSLSKGARSEAVSYIELKGPTGTSCFGAGIDTNISMASIRGVVSALNRLVKA